MRIGAIIIFLAIVGVVTAAITMIGDIALGESALTAQTIADAGLLRGEPRALQQLLAEKQQGSTYGVTDYAATDACSSADPCPYKMQVSYSIANGDGDVNETTGDLNLTPAVDEKTVYLEETATVKSMQGAVLATRTRWLQIVVSLEQAAIVGRFDNAAAAGAALVAQGVHGCDGSSLGGYQSTCNANATQAGDDTRTGALLTCTDDAALNAYCNGATPRPDDDYSKVQTNDTGASSDGFAR